MKNILVSSTRQWNCGDEFIWFGIRRLLKESGVEANTILFNRHPDVQPRFRVMNQIKPSKDNSFFLDQDTVIDYAIFAGTPEWHRNPMVNPMLEYIRKNKTRTAFIGVGAGAGKPPEVSTLLKEVLTKCTDFVIARDAHAYQAVKEYVTSYQDVCPALFAAPTEDVRDRTELKKLGIVIQASDRINQKIPEKMKEELRKQYQALEKDYEVRYVAHYIDDWKYANDIGIAKKTHYSSFAEDYFDIYAPFDCVISTRVHGCGIAASLGCPSLMISHDGRAQTAEGFLSKIISSDASIKEELQKMAIPEVSKTLTLHRKERQREYQKRIEKHVKPHV